MLGLSAGDVIALLSLLLSCLAVYRAEVANRRDRTPDIVVRALGPSILCLPKPEPHRVIFLLVRIENRGAVDVSLGGLYLRTLPDPSMVPPRIDQKWPVTLQPRHSLEYQILDAEIQRCLDNSKKDESWLEKVRVYGSARRPTGEVEIVAGVHDALGNQHESEPVRWTIGAPLDGPDLRL